MGNLVNNWNTLSILLTLGFATLIFASGSINASLVNTIENSVFSPINNSGTYNPSLNGYGYQLNGTLTVIKHVVGGGPWGPSNFTMVVYNYTPAGKYVLLTTFPGSATGVSVSLAGTYDVSELSDTNYKSTFSSECYGTISAGQNATCVITNRFLGEGHLKVIKKVVGGPYTASNFTMEVYNVTGSGSGVQEFFVTSFPGSATGTTIPLLGAYDMNESAASYNVSLSNYTTTYSNGCWGTLSAGQNATCVITNKYIGNNQTGELTVIKRVIGGSFTASNFTMNVWNTTRHGRQVLLDAFAGSATGVTVPVSGLYSVSETSANVSLSRYTTTFSGGCYGTLADGQNATCVITNRLKHTGRR